MDWNRFFSNLWDYTINLFISLAIISVVVLFGYLIFKCSSTPNKIDYCYVSSREVVIARESAIVYTLYGDIPWGQDRQLGDFKNAYDAQQYAVKINCPMDVTPIPAAHSSAIPATSASANLQ